MVLKSAQILGKETEEAELIAKIKEQMPENGYFSYEQGKLAPDIIETDYPADFVGLPVGREELRAIRDREAERMER